MRRASWHVRAQGLVGAWLVATVVAVLAHRALPAAGWLLVHLLLLGAVSTAIHVWSQHFADTLLRRPAPGGRRAHTARLAAHTLGALLVVTGLVGARWPLVVAGGTLVAGAALALAATVVVQHRRAFAARFGGLVRYYVAAGAVLPVGATLGVLMARAGVPDDVHARLYVAHVALNLLGWVGLTVLGTLLVLWPTVLHVRITPGGESAGPRALPVLLGGLATLGAACAVGWRPGVLLGCLVVVAGTSVIARELVREAWDAPPVTYAGWTLAAALAWFAGCTLALGLLVATAPSWEVVPERLAVLVAPFAVGFAAQVLIGSLSHLLPVVLGGGPAVHRRTAALLDSGSAARVVLVNGGLVLYVLPVPSLVRVVVSFVVLGALVAFAVLAMRAVGAALRARRPHLTPTAPAPVGPPPGPVAGRRTGHGTAAVAVLALAVAAGAAGDPAAAGLTLAAPTDPAASTGRTTTVEVQAGDMRFTPDRVEVPAGDRLVVRFTNADDDVHDLVLASGVSTGRVAPGSRVELDAGVVVDDLDGWCSVAGHRLMGMTLDVVVTGAVGTTADGGGTTGGDGTGRGMHGSGTAPTASAVDDVDLRAEPGPGFEAYDATLEPLDGPPGTHHEVTLTVSEVVREVAPGVTQRLWTFGGQAPGPTLHGQVGDTFAITLVNDGSIGHSIDFHAGALAPDGPMRTIAPGESLVYELTATRSGIWMYHCSTMPMSVHIASGMFGAVVIDPPGLPAVDREYVVVQHELYLGPQDGETDAVKVAAAEPDLVVFNGYANQYRHRPLTAQVGERVRMWVLDAGPSGGSAFHVVGGQFDTVYSEGDYLLRDGGSTGTGGAQVLALSPAQGGFVELTFPEAGRYPFVTHAMADAERGAAGLVEVGPAAP
jgi:nitrite reductase (NO-forming)